MIIMINGAFGAGKTSVANELLRRLDGAMLFDPEVVGFMLRHIIPDEMKLDRRENRGFSRLEDVETIDGRSGKTTSRDIWQGLDRADDDLQ